MVVPIKCRYLKIEWNPLGYFGHGRSLREAGDKEIKYKFTKGIVGRKGHLHMVKILILKIIILFLGKSCSNSGN